MKKMLSCFVFLRGVRLGALGVFLCVHVCLSVRVSVRVFVCLFACLCVCPVSTR